MTKAVVVAFNRPFPRTDEQYRTQEKLFFKYAQPWLNLVDKLYLFDVGWHFRNSYHPNTKNYIIDYSPHWDNLRMVCKDLTTDSVMFVDEDMLIYDPEVVANGFKDLEENNVVAITDNSGSKPLDDIWPGFGPNQLRDYRRRICPYLCFIRTEDLLKTDCDFAPKLEHSQTTHDCMGWVTEQLVKQPNFRIKELPDDRTTLYYRDGKMEEVNWLDAPSFKWSEPTKQSLGYYHVRNSTFGLSMLAEYHTNRPAYERRKEITPPSEAFRLLAWQWIYDQLAGELQWHDQFVPVLADLGMPMGTWLVYINHFMKYHEWLNPKPEATK